MSWRWNGLKPRVESVAVPGGDEDGFHDTARDVTSHLVLAPAHSGAGGLAGNSEAQPEEPETLESVLGPVGGAMDYPSEWGVKSAVLEAPERVLACDRANCSAPRRSRHGRFCSDACRAADWKERHGGAQRLIDWGIIYLTSLGK